MSYKVYCMEFKNGLKYIGCTHMSISKRMSRHRAVHEWAKDKSQCNVKILFETENEFEALAMEAAKVLEFDTTNPEKGYNRKFGGGNSAKQIPENVERITELFRMRAALGLNGMLGKKHSQKTKLLIAQKAKGRIGYWRGKKLTEEMRLQRNEKRAGKGYFSGEQHPNFGKKWSAEIRAKMSAGQYRRTDRPMLGKKMSLEARAKMKAYWASRRKKNT